MASAKRRVIIIGAGHNGLTCAAYLAKAGLDVTVLERRDIVGGAAVTEEFHPGYRNSTASYTVSLLNPKVIADLDLARHGLRIVERPMANFWPMDDQRYLLMPHGLAAQQKAIAMLSPKDAERLPAYDAALKRATAVLRDLMLRTPPTPGGGFGELLRNSSLAMRLWRLDADDYRLLLDLFTKSASDYLDMWFQNETVKAAFAFDGIVGAYAAPSTPGTAYVLLHHCFGEVNGKPGVWGHALGGMGAISQAMAHAAQAAGATIKTGVGVKRIIPDGGTIHVEMADGTRHEADVVAANVGPKYLFATLLDDGAVDAEIAQRFRAIRTGSGTFRMNVALSELPDFTCLPGRDNAPHHGAGIIIGPTIDYLEQAYLDARTNGWSLQPIIELVIPSTLDPGLAPEGHHVASLFVQHVAPTLPSPRSWADESEKERFADVVVDTMTAYAPNFSGSIIARQIQSPLDLEQRFGLTDGDIFHGQLGLDQLFSARPVLGYGNYRMPVKDLYLCGSGAHPGGGVTGLPGHNCAREILADLGLK